MANDMLHLAFSVAAQESAKISCNELVTEQPLSLDLSKFWEICTFSALKRRTSACRVFDLHLSFSSILRNRGICTLCAPKEPTAF